MDVRPFEPSPAQVVSATARACQNCGLLFKELNRHPYNYDDVRVWVEGKEDYVDRPRPHASHGHCPRCDSHWIVDLSDL